MNMKKKLLFSILTFFLFLSFIIILEFGARYYLKIKIEKNFGENLKSKSYGVVRSDKKFGLITNSNSYNRNRITNNFGYFNYDDLKLPKDREIDEIVIISYGGSTTYSYGLDQKEAWPILLQKKACDKKKERPCKISIMNGGIIRWSLSHIYEKAIIDIPKLKPNFLIIYSGINEYDNYNLLKFYDKIDIDNQIINKNYGLISSGLNSWVTKNNSLLLKSFYYKVVFPLLNKFRYSIINKDSKKLLNKEKDFDLIYKNYIEILKNLINLSNKHDTKIIFVTQTFGVNNKDNILFTSFSNKAKNDIKNSGIIIIDSSEIFENYSGSKEDLFFPSGLHYSLKGSNLLSDLILIKLEERNIF